MSDSNGPVGLSRRELLSKSAAVCASLVVGSSFVASSTAVWAMETNSLSPTSMATLIQMARDIYPHDKIGDEYYAKAVKGYDNSDMKGNIEAGIASLDAAAQGRGYANYLAVGWEQERVAILRGMERSPFFQQIRGGLVTGLYNQKEVWPIFGYEGSSFEKGGYINRGFNDVNWI